MESRELKLNGVLHHYRVTGEGAPMILLHGNDGDNEYFSYQIDYFKSKYRVYAMDTEGHGRSGFGRGDLNTVKLAGHLEKFIRALELDRPIVLGFSDGANIVMKLVTNTKIEMRSLVLISGNLHPDGMKPIPRLGGYLLESVTGLLGIFSKKMRQKSNVYHLSNLGAEVSTEELANIKCPTLVMAGERDLIPLEHTRQIHDALKNSEMIILKNAGHELLREIPEEANRRIGDFLKRCENNL